MHFLSSSYQFFWENQLAFNPLVLKPCQYEIGTQPWFRLASMQTTNYVEGKMYQAAFGKKQLLWAVRWKDRKPGKGRGGGGWAKGEQSSFLSSCFNCIWSKLQIYLLATKADWLVSSLRTQIWETTSPYSLSEGDGNPSCSLQGCLKTLLYLWERGAESNLMGINSKHAGGFNSSLRHAGTWFG